MSLGAVVMAAPFAWADDVPEAARLADVVFLGEVHDNATHHARQAAWVAGLKPQALVFEMIRREDADALAPQLRSDAEALEAAFKWEDSGWPDFDMYFPIFAAAPEARILGAALPRDAVRGVMDGSFEAVLPKRDVDRFDLAAPLPAEEQRRREALQAEAHCDALPENLLPGMVRVQRARDTALAAAVAEALEQGLRPVAVITGNGHARTDWGAPAILRQALPDVKVFSLGQGEEGGVPPGGFDVVSDAPMVQRGDPCEAFR